MIDSVLSALRAHERFLITTHARPDGDAVGSQLGLGRFLEKRGKQVTLLNSDPPGRTLEWIPGVEDVEVFEGTFEQLKSLTEAEVIFVLDTNVAERLEKLADPVRKSGAVKVLVDHHTNPEDWFDLAYQRDTASSTGELVYELIRADKPDLVDAEIATALYTAIMTDTGSFRYSSVTPETHRVVADLLERGGIQPAPIHAALYDNRSLASVRLLGLALDRVKLAYDGRIGYTVVTGDMMRRVGADSDDKEGIVGHVLSIEGVQAALLFTETSGGAKVSFRSEAGVHVNEWAASFDGGGHRNASGAYIKLPLNEAIDAVLEAAPRFIDLSDPENGDTLSEADASYLSTMLDLQQRKAS